MGRGAPHHYNHHFTISLHLFRNLARGSRGCQRSHVNPLNINVGQRTGSLTTLHRRTAATLVRCLGNEAHLHAVNQIGRNILRLLHAVAHGRRLEEERADAVQFHRATLSHVVAHHARQSLQHRFHVSRTHCRFCRQSLRNLVGRHRATHKHRLRVPQLAQLLVNLLVKSYTFTLSFIVPRQAA